MPRPACNASKQLNALVTKAMQKQRVEILARIAFEVYSERQNATNRSETYDLRKKTHWKYKDVYTNYNKERKLVWKSSWNEQMAEHKC